VLWKEDWKKKYGSDVLFLNGALGCLIQPLRADVWEVSERFPIIGDGEKLPDGAKAVEKTFRKTFLIGRELANIIDKTIQNGRLLPPVEFKYKSQTFFTRATNLKFRLGMAIARPGNRGIFSYSKREAFICNRTNDEPVNCISDGFQNVFIQDIPVPVRMGEYLETETILVDLGDIRILTIPGEAPPELLNGLPRDFGRSYYRNPDHHAIENYTLPGNAKDILKCDNQKTCWYVGLGYDELGYMVPINDIRIKCTLDPIDCRSLPLTFRDSMSGPECKFIFENQEAARRRYGTNYSKIAFVCRVGLIDTAQNHYEETNGFGWDLTSDYIRSIRKLVQN